MLKKSWLVLFSIFFLSCNKEVVTDLGHDFFPLDNSVYRVYDVTETSYLEGEETIDTYQLRESISDSLETNGQWTYILLIERRDSEQENWRSVEIVSVRRTNRMLEFRQANRSYIKMSFPVRIGRFWDGNSLNELSETTYSFQELEEQEPFNSDDHIRLVISDLPANIVEQDEREEIYARGIGLVERDFKQIEFCQQGCSGVNEPENGTILYQRLIELGEF